MIFASGISLRTAATIRARGSIHHFRNSSAGKFLPRYRKSAQHRPRLQIAGSDSSPKPSTSMSIKLRKRIRKPIGKQPRRKLVHRSMPRDHVRRQSPRRTAKSQQRHRRRQILLYPRDRFVDRFKRFVIDLAAQSLQRCRILQRIEPWSARPPRMIRADQAHAAPPEYRKTRSQHQNRSGESAAKSPLPPRVGSKQRSRKLPAFARIARYSGRYLPACRISQIGGMDCARLPASTTAEVCFAEVSATLPF